MLKTSLTMDAEVAIMLLGSYVKTKCMSIMTSSMRMEYNV